MVMGRLRSGAWVTMHGCGEAIPSCASDVRVFCSQAILRTGIWGERLDIQRAGAKQLRPVKVPASNGVWQQFMAVRRGEIANPSPPEVGLRMAATVRCDQGIGCTRRATGAPGVNSSPFFFRVKSGHPTIGRPLFYSKIGYLLNNPG